MFFSIKAQTSPRTHKFHNFDHLMPKRKSMRKLILPSCSYNWHRNKNYSRLYGSGKSKKQRWKVSTTKIFRWQKFLFPLKECCCCCCWAKKLLKREIIEIKAWSRERARKCNKIFVSVGKQSKLQRRENLDWDGKSITQRILHTPT